MAVDTPARIAVLGAGPIGLECALYARFLGYDVVIFERGRVCDNVLRWGHVRMFSPFGMNRSTLGLAALAAHDTDYRPPADSALLLGREWVERYLLPLSQTDLLHDHMRADCEVRAVTRQTLRKTDHPAQPCRGESPFRLLLETRDGQQHDEAADVVIDTTGIYGNPNRLGRGGAPACGETRCSGVDYHIPDVRGVDRARFCGRHTLVVGAGYSAATSIVALRGLVEEDASTRVTWVTRRPLAAGADGPMELIAEDRLPERAQLAREANRCLRVAQIDHRPDTVVRAIAHDENSSEFHVELAGDCGPLSVDNVVANVGYRPDIALTRELQVHLCYATEGPMRLAAKLLGAGSNDCLDQTSHGPEVLRTTEPNFYVLGAKSYGRDSKFLVSLGLQQIRELFTIIGDREDLDLYRGATSLIE